MIKIITILGARPQFIKAAIVSKALSSYPNIKEIIVHTGQHFDHNMSEIFFTEMDIPIPLYNLDIHSLSHGAMTGRMIENIEGILMKEMPDFVMIYGDTNSTIAGALAAKKLHIKVIHVEAGVRSFNIKMPEEINRILTDRISDILFSPTDIAVKNLKNEGFNNIDCQIIKNGDVMQDAAYFYANLSHEKSTIIRDQNATNYILATLHRAENTDNPKRMNEIIGALNDIHKDKKIILPLHPRTRNILTKMNLKVDVDVIDPVGYFDMLELIKNADLIVTDSGGLQKEAFFFKKHCVTLRDETEWVELLDNGFNILGGNCKKVIKENIKKMMEKKSDFNINLYGNGIASEKIAEYLNNISL